ncbi:MAG: hypothetical protein PWP06_1487, partial [Candidatus Marinimicrobia bacterium]|nr:hypothetical protein [Candidatus Neomarinimicrobiota bacterium]
MIQILKYVFKIHELLKRILFTVLIL